MTSLIKNKPIIWTISGSDCSGGAGIAADIKTGHTLGVEVCHLITANTVQNSQQLVSVNPIEPTILQQQADILLADKQPQVIKVGLLASKAQVNWLVTLLTQLKSTLTELKVVFDPVGQASVGGRNGGKFSDLTMPDLNALLPLIDVLTPNANEAVLFAESKALNAKPLAQNILAKGVNTVVIKGGHDLIDNANESDSNEYCVDYCLHTLTDDDSSKMSEDELIEYRLNSPRINTRYSHGGGCSFASALSSFLAHGYLVRDAFTLAKAFVNQGLIQTKDKIDHYGAFEQTMWPEQAEHFPEVNGNLQLSQQNIPAFASLNLPRGGNESLGLYPVIDSLYWLARLLPLNLNIIQLRVKNKSPAELESIIAKAVELAKPYKTRLFINDYWELAIKYGAYGVHIGQEDLQEADLAKIQAAGLRLGISTHGCYEFLLAQQLKPSYLAIGAIFPTQTKDMTGQIQGIENLEQTLTLATDIPVVAIGGINHARAPEVWNTGVDSIAVVTAITLAESPESAVQAFQTVLR